jgi:hypothetical protein
MSPEIHAPDGTYNPFPNYNFTGSMRPAYPLSSKRKIPDHIQLPDYVTDGPDIKYDCGVGGTNLCGF